MNKKINHTLELGYTSSSVGTAMSCLRKYKYKYIDLFRELNISTAALAGSLSHIGFESFWKGESLVKAISNMRLKSVGHHEWDLQCHQDKLGNIGDVAFWESEEGMITFSKCKAYVIGYYSKYEEADWTKGGKETCLTEQEFRFELDGHTFRGKWDVFIFERGTPVIYDHKTTSVSIETETGVFFERLPMDVQCTIYREAAWRMDNPSGTNINPFPTVFYDVVGSTKSTPKQKKKIAKRKSESDEEYAIRKDENQETLDEFDKRMIEYYLTKPEKYIRYEVPCTITQHERRLAELLTFVGILNTGRIHHPELFEIRNSSACFSYGGCTYMDVCLGRDSLESSTKLIQIDTNHPELNDKDTLVLNRR